MNEATNNPLNNNSGIGETITTALRQPSFLRGLSPTVLFVGFVFWAWLRGGPGAFLAAPLTIFLVLMLDTFPETRWLAAVMGASPPDPDVPAPEGGDRATPMNARA